MSNYFYEDAFMESTNYYHKENTWNETCYGYGEPEYGTSCHYEESHTISIDDAYIRWRDNDERISARIDAIMKSIKDKDRDNSWDGQCYGEPQYVVSNHYEESIKLDRLENMCIKFLEKDERISARIDELIESYQSMFANSQWMLAHTSTSNDEELIEENDEVELDTHALAYEAPSPPAIPLEILHPGYEMTYYELENSSCIKEEQVSEKTRMDENVFSNDALIIEMLEVKQNDSSHLYPEDPMVLFQGQIGLENIESPMEQKHENLLNHP